MFSILLFSLIVSVVTIAYGFFLMFRVLKNDQGNDKMRSIARAIEEGSNAYMRREFKVAGSVGVVIAILLWIFLGKVIAIAFVVGAIASFVAGYIGMFVAVKSNVRVAQKAREFENDKNKGLQKAFGLAFQGGSVTGLLVAGLALLSLTIFFIWSAYERCDGNPTSPTMSSRTDASFKRATVSIICS